MNMFDIEIINYFETNELVAEIYFDSPQWAKMSWKKEGGSMLNSIKTISLVVLFLCGCDVNKKKDQSSDYVVCINQMVKSFAKVMKKEFGLVCYGSGGSMPYDIEEICIKFIAYHPATIEEARELEVMVTEKFIETINSNEKIRPFLREYPIKADRAEVAISFYKQNNTPFTDGSVAYVTQLRNKISYCSENESNGNLVTLKEEPYEEALKIVKGSARSN